MVGAMFLFGGVIAALVALWIWMIIDCAKRKFKNDNEQVVWILILVFTGWLGAIIYYFAVKKQDKKKK
ncbi:PLDc N-terminal domain-containing protein [Candidatus Woesearchaeota archaeon]|nr:PLDc N-terminal domain-containing protein [Candidatus Woesearchaeota archaeon]